MFKVLSLKFIAPLTAVLLVAGCSSSESSSGGTSDSSGSEPAMTAPPTSFDLDYVPESMRVLFEENEIFSTFAELVALTDLAPLFEADGEITVFLVPNVAFERLPAGTLDKLKDPANRELLTRILSYHMLDGRVKEMDVKAGTLVMKSGDEMTVEVGEEVGYLMNIRLNETTVIVGDLFAGKSVAHVLAALVLPPGVDLDSL